MNTKYWKRKREERTCSVNRRLEILRKVVTPLESPLQNLSSKAEPSRMNATALDKRERNGEKEMAKVFKGVHTSITAHPKRRQGQNMSFHCKKLGAKWEKHPPSNDESTRNEAPKCQASPWDELT